MIERYTQGALTWIDLLNPTQDEIRELQLEVKLPPELFDDLAMPIPHPIVTVDGKAVKVVLDFPIVRRTDIDHPHEVKFIMSKKTLITARYEEMEALHRFAKEFDVITTLYKTNKKADGGHLFFSILEDIYIALTSKLDYLDSKITDIEQEIFNGREKEMVVELSQVGRRLLAFRQTLKTHDDVYRELKDGLREIYKDVHDDDLTTMYLRHELLVRRTNGLFDVFVELRNTNMAILSTKQNEVMKILTIMAFVTFPLSLFASVFGMNTKTLPLTGYDGDFYIIIGVMAIAAIGFFIFFKYKRWM